MKSSDYNIYVPIDGGTQSIIFNSLTKKFLICSNHHLRQFRSVIESPDEYHSELSLNNLITRLKDGGFIIGDDVNEFSIISEQIQSAVNDDYCNITIMTSYACNFSCWYCVQKHKGIYIETSTEVKIMNFIESFLNNNNNIKYFHISWFGGEPLLNFDAIRSISMFAKKMCVLKNIHFACGITTNGSLLNQTMIEEMKQLNFLDYQITIDGAKENHNKTRYNLKINDSFSLLLANITKVVKTIPDALLTLRINYTRTNLSPNLVEDIDKILNPVREKIFVLFRKVWQEPYDETMLKQVSSLSSQFKRLGYIIEHDFDRSDMLTCYAEHKNYITIFPNGAVDKCTNKDVFDARGCLSESGEIIWKEQPREFSVSALSNDSDCSKCRYFPICLGPCPLHREKMVNRVICDKKEIEKWVTQDILEYCRIHTNYEF